MQACQPPRGTSTYSLGRCYAECTSLARCTAQIWILEWDCCNVCGHLTGFLIIWYEQSRPQDLKPPPPQPSTICFHRSDPLLHASSPSVAVLKQQASLFPRQLTPQSLTQLDRPAGAAATAGLDRSISSTSLALSSSQHSQQPLKKNGGIDLVSSLPRAGRMAPKHRKVASCVMGWQLRSISGPYHISDRSINDDDDRWLLHLHCTHAHSIHMAFGHPLPAEKERSRRGRSRQSVAGRPSVQCRAVSTH